MKQIVKRWLLLLPPIRLFDAAYHLIYFVVAHRRIPRRNSGLFNDYLYFLKTGTEFDSALRQFVSDKNLVKIYYRGLLTRDLAPRTLAIFCSITEFEKAVLPCPCVIKPTHLSGCVYYTEKCPGLSAEQQARIAEWFRTNMYRDVSRERNYRQLQPSVVCEELIADHASVRDYKIFCYSGEPRAVQVDVDRHSGHKRRMYTTDWQALPYSYNKPLAEIESKPPQIDAALSLASQLSRGFEFMRVDVYLTKDRVYLGEMTSVPENAHGRFESILAESRFSRLIFDGHMA